MKVVINKCYGGFGLSPIAKKELYNKKGKECYFFDHDIKTGEYKPITLEEAENAFMCFEYSVPNPQDYDLDKRDEDGLYGSANERARSITIDTRSIERHDKDLVSIVESLGEKAGSKFANLRIVEIPDGVYYEISEYDGMEHIAESHRTWG